MPPPTVTPHDRTGGRLCPSSVVIRSTSSSRAWLPSCPFGVVPEPPGGLATVRTFKSDDRGLNCALPMVVAGLAT